MFAAPLLTLPAAALLSAASLRDPGETVLSSGEALRGLASAMSKDANGVFASGLSLLTRAATLRGAEAPARGASLGDAEAAAVMDGCAARQRN